MYPPDSSSARNAKKKKLEEAKAKTKFLRSEDTTRRANHPRLKNQPLKSIEQCVREADALGISYGQYVARSLDKVE